MLHFATDGAGAISFGSWQWKPSLRRYALDNAWLSGEDPIADTARWCRVRVHKWSMASVEALATSTPARGDAALPGVTAGALVSSGIDDMLEDGRKAAAFSNRVCGLLQKCWRS